MRTNHSGVTEKAEFNIDRDKYGENFDRIFGKKDIEENACCSICGELEEVGCECHNTTIQNNSQPRHS